MKKQFYLLATGLILVASTQAQIKIKDGSVSGSTSLPNSAAILDLESSNKGLLLPRVALTNTTTWGLAGVAVSGMSVYNTAAGITSTNAAYPIVPGGIGTYYWKGTGWVATAYPTAANFPTLYTADGALTGERTVTLGANALHFVNSDPTAGGKYEFLNTSGSGPTFAVSANSATGSSTMRLIAGGTSLDLQHYGGNSSQIVTNSTQSLNLIASSSTADIRFFAGGTSTQRMIIDHTGTVGIGSMGTPNSSLQVAGSVSTNIVEVSGSYTALATDYTIVFNTTAAGTTLTLPTANTCQGRIYVLVNFADAVTIGIDASAPIYAYSGVAIPYLPTDGGGSATIATGNRITIQSTGSRWVIISAG